MTFACGAAPAAGAGFGAAGAPSFGAWTPAVGGGGATGEAIVAANDAAGAPPARADGGAPAGRGGSGGGRLFEDGGPPTALAPLPLAEMSGDDGGAGEACTVPPPSGIAGNGFDDAGKAGLDGGPAGGGNATGEGADTGAGAPGRAGTTAPATGMPPAGVKPMPPPIGRPGPV